MLDQTHSIDLTRADLDLIESALQTQEKILTMQSRAGGQEARTRLGQLKAVLSRVRRQRPKLARPASNDGWCRIARSLL